MTIITNEVSISYGRRTGIVTTPLELSLQIADKLSPYIDQEQKIIEFCAGGFSMTEGAIVCGANPDNCFGVEVDAEVWEDLTVPNMNRLSIPQEQVFFHDALTFQSGPLFDLGLINPPYDIAGKSEWKFANSLAKNLKKGAKMAVIMPYLRLGQQYKTDKRAFFRNNRLDEVWILAEDTFAASIKTVVCFFTVGENQDWNKSIPFTEEYGSGKRVDYFPNQDNMSFIPLIEKPPLVASEGQDTPLSTWFDVINPPSGWNRNKPYVVPQDTEGALPVYGAKQRNTALYYAVKNEGNPFPIYPSDTIAIVKTGTTFVSHVIQNPYFGSPNTFVLIQKPGYNLTIEQLEHFKLEIEKYKGQRTRENCPTQDEIRGLLVSKPASL